MKSNQSKAKKIYNAVSTVIVALIFVFMIVVVAVMLVQKNNGGETELFGYRMYDVLTDSMSGTIEPGDVIMCQVVKDHFGTKGVRISQNVSIPGRLLVIMPYVNFVGISHKIEDEDERKRLEQLVSSHQPQNIGFIVRTEAAKASDEEILAEMDKLVSKWKNILSSFQRAPVCTTVYEEGDLIFRTIRDFLSDDVDDIFVNNENVYRDLA